MKVSPGYRKVPSRKDTFDIDFVVTLPDGTLHRERERLVCPGGVREIQAIVNRRKTDFRLGNVDPRALVLDDVPTLADFTPDFLAKYVRVNNKPSEVWEKERTLKVEFLPLWGTRKLSAITTEDIEGYKAAKLQAGCGKKTINNYIGTLAVLFNVAVEWKRIPAAAIPTIKKFKKATRNRTDFLLPHELDTLLAAASPYWRRVFHFAAKTGLRPGELVALRWDAVDLVARKVIVHQAAWEGEINDTPKDGETRVVQLADSLVHELRQHRHLRPFVFDRADGTMMSQHSFNRALRRYCRACGLRSVGPYIFRHTFASHLAMAGVTAKVIAELLGHASISMTDRYMHLAPGQADSAVNALDALQMATTSQRLLPHRPAPGKQRVKLVGATGFEPDSET